MAIQNFLSGGYYGKLGATVGQRWKNKRTIRTYVVPANPRTEIQQANRNKFANAVTYAQVGMQMNYYATCFNDPNFTHWNYRMKTARELKNAGLSNLDLIPLYPLTFTPPTLIDEIQKDTTTGAKHIRFAVSALNGNEDRTLSLMFALYDEKDNYLGLKLYLGYYYAANPGYLEVDVDNISEINSHCFVRIVSNDDKDSATDLIASPSLKVKALDIDVHNFNTAIISLSKDNTGITITFNELWKGIPSENKVVGSVNCIICGANKAININNAELFDNGGYCAVKVPYIVENTEYLPAFPAGSEIKITSIVYNGPTWQITNANQTESYSDDDLTRNIQVAPTWNTSDTGDITFNLNFFGTVAAYVANFDMVCSGRFDLRTAESQSFSISGDGTKLTFVCTGSRKHYPMANAGDQIAITAQNFVCNGVTYQLAAQNIALRNAITTSEFMKELEWNFIRDGLQDSNPIIWITANCNLTNVCTYTKGSVGNLNWVSSLANPATVDRCSPNDPQDWELEYSTGDRYLYLTANFEDQTHQADVTSLWLVNYENQSLPYNGISYKIPIEDFPTIVSGYQN